MLHPINFISPNIPLTPSTESDVRYHLSLRFHPTAGIHPGGEKLKTETKRQVYKRSRLDSNSLGRYASQTTYNISPPAVSPLKYCSAVIVRQCTSWKPTTTSNTRRALPHGGPSPPWAESGCDPGEASFPDTVCWCGSSHERDHDRSFFVCSQTPPNATTPHALAAALDEPTMETRATLATAASTAPATSPLLSPPCYHLLWQTPGRTEMCQLTRLAVPSHRYHPSSSCLKAYKCANCRGVRYHPPCCRPSATGVIVLHVPNISRCTHIAPHRYHPSVVECCIARINHVH